MKKNIVRDFFVLLFGVRFSRSLRGNSGKAVSLLIVFLLLVSVSLVEAKDFIGPSEGSRFYIDPDNRNIGIGTKDPGALLHIFNPTDRTSFRINMHSTSASVFPIRVITDQEAKFYLNAAGSIWTKGNISADGVILANITAPHVGSGIFGSEAGKGNYTFQAATSVNPVLFVDAANERVGIGTTGPGARLQITSTDSNHLRLHVTSNFYWNIYRNFADGALRFDDGINGNAVTIKPDGNVGIGTTSPNAKLHVGGNVLVGGHIQVPAGYAFKGSVGLVGVYMSSPSAGDIKLRTTSTDNVMIIKDNGNVGIGTISPSEKLDVDGKIRMRSQTVSGDGSDIVATKGYVDGQIGEIDTSNWAQSGSNLYPKDLNWNVGIGTGSPGAKLNVAGTGLFTDVLTVEKSPGRLMELKWTGTGDTADGLWLHSESTYSPRIFLTQGGTTNNATVILGTSNSIALRTGGTVGSSSGTVRLTVDATRTTLDGHLRVGGQDVITSSRVLQNMTTGSFSGNVTVADPETDSHAATKGYVDGQIGGIDASNWTQSGSNLYPKNTAWNIGIGMTNPQYGKLEIRTSASNTGGLTLWRGTEKTARSWINSSDTWLMQRGTTDTAGLVITSVGDVGIGTIDPGAKFHVIGQARTSNVDGSYLVPTAETHLTPKRYVDETINQQIIEQVDSSKWTQSGNNIYNKNSGNVGIGIINPSQKFEVSGISRFNSGASFSAINTGFASAHGYSSGDWGVRLGATGGAGVIQAAQVSTPYPISLNPYGGNVGIGTTTVGARLTLADHTTNTGGIRFRTASTAVDLYSRGSAILTTAANFEAGSYRVGTTEVISSGRVHIAADGSAGTPAFRFSAQNGVGMYRAASNVLAFSTAGTERIRVDASGNVGINVTPSAKLHALGFVRGDYLVPTDQYHFTPKHYVDGLASKWTQSGNNIYNENSGNVGIGIASPSTKLHVSGDVTVTNGNINFTGTGRNITNVQKITVETIDPIYKIGEERYATYAPFMIGGVKEEVTGTVTLSSSHTIDFNNLERGSKLWLFYQITDFGKNMENLQVFLTPGFRGAVWYEKDSRKNTITIHGTRKGEVSFRLIADRFDHEKWGILADPEDPTEGIKVKEK